MKKNKDIPYIIIIILVTTIILLQLFLNVRYEGHDTIFHISNIIKLSNTISIKNIFGSNIIAHNFNPYGYGVWLFYPKLPHLSTAYIYLLTKDIYLSMKIIYFITTSLSGIFTYYLAKKITKNKEVSLLSSIIYLTTPYHLCEIYVRDAIAENFMFLVLPMIFLGLYNLKENNYKKFYILFILGYIIGMNSHLISMVYYTFFVGIFILYYRKEYLKKDKIKALVISTIIVTITVLPSLVNLISHKMLGIYRVFTSEFSSILDVTYNALDFSSLYNQNTILNKIQPYFSIITIILFLITTINLMLSKNKPLKKDKKILLIFIIILINLICSRIIWQYLPDFLYSIQFPWRLLVLLSLIVALYSTLILLNEKIPTFLKKTLPLMIVILVITEGISNIIYFSGNVMTINEALNSTISLGFQHEYLPYTEDSDFKSYVKCHKKYFQCREEGIIPEEKLEINIINEEFPNLEFEIKNIKKETIIELPRIYYLGYKLTDNDNKKLNLTMNENGFLEAKITKNGIYKLQYNEIIQTKRAKIIRITTFVILGIIIVYKRRLSNAKNTTN